MLPEQQQALRQGGAVLRLKQHLDRLYAQFQDQQVEKDQQLQQTLGQGNTYLKHAQTIREAEALLKQLKTHLTSEGRGLSGLPFWQLQELTADLRRKLQQEENTARQELQKALHHAASALLQSLEATGDLNRLSQLCRLAGKCEEMVAEVAGLGYASGGREGPGVENDR